MPGIIDPHSHTMADAINEGSLSVTSMVRMTDVLDPTNINIYRQLAGRRDDDQPASRIGEHHRRTERRSEAQVRTRRRRTCCSPARLPGIKFALGENVTQKNSQTAAQAPGRPLRYPATRMGQEEVLRDAFTRARDYKAAWDDYNAKAKTRQDGDSARPQPRARPARGSARGQAASCTRTRIAPTRCSCCSTSPRSSASR